MLVLTYFIKFGKRALQVYPHCPAAVRLGIALCRYKLGQLDKARQAFLRVLQARDYQILDLFISVACGTSLTVLI